MNSSPGASSSDEDLALKTNTCDTHDGSILREPQSFLFDGVGYVLDISRHLRRIFREGISYSSGKVDGCVRCGVVIGAAECRDEHSGFGMASGPRTWCMACHGLIGNSTGLLDGLITNRKFTIGMEQRLARTVSYESLVKRCGLPGGSLCEIWLGDVNPGGYPLIELEGVLLYAHRVSFLAAGKTLSPVQVVRHCCDKRLNDVVEPDKRCIRPQHLWAGTKEQNTLDWIRTQMAARAAREANGPLRGTETP